MQHRTPRSVYGRGNGPVLFVPRRRPRDGASRGYRLHSLILVAILLGLAALLLSGCGKSSADKELNVSGSTTILPIAEEAAESFQSSHPGTKILVSGLGSSAGIEAVSAGTAAIGTSSRDLKPEESKLGLVDFPIAYDGIAVIVNPANPVSGLTMQQLADVFSGKTTNWKQLGGQDRPIELVNRDESSGTREAFQKLVMKDASFNPAATVLPGTGQVRDVVARSEGAVGYISLGFVKARYSSLPVKALVIDGITPSEKSVADKSYPIGRVLHFFTKGKPQGLTKEFVDFVLSDKVQKGVVVDAGFIPIAEGGKQ